MHPRPAIKQPEPADDESEQDFMDRCIDEVSAVGDADLAEEVCANLWEESRGGRLSGRLMRAMPAASSLFYLMKRPIGWATSSWSTAGSLPISNATQSLCLVIDPIFRSAHGRICESSASNCAVVW